MKRIITFLLMGMMCWLNADAAPINRQAAMQKAAAFLKEMKVSQHRGAAERFQPLMSTHTMSSTAAMARDSSSSLATIRPSLCWAIATKARSTIRRRPTT